MSGGRLLLTLATIGGAVAGGVAAYHHLRQSGSVAAYCKVFYGDGQQLRSEYQVNSGQPLQELADMLSAPAQLVSFFGKLDAVAPPSIEPDVGQLQQALQQESSGEGGDLSDPLAGLASGLVDGLASEPAYSVVNSWTEQSYAPAPASFRLIPTPRRSHSLDIHRQ